MASATSDLPTPADGSNNGDIQTLFSTARNALADQEARDIFTVGGKLEISDSPASFGAPTARPVVIRWDSKHDGGCGRSSFPVSKNDGSSDQAFQKLLKDCEPATFGFGQRDVLDESYRKAGKMDVNDFCTNFNPYEHGIMDTVNQALAQNNPASERHRGVKAEMYNLNVYSGPSGRFKPHVDTPRSEAQMGSLVVCLPCEHRGGRLAVRHASIETVYDWAPESSATIQWAAFFSNCEHEVLDVTEGHRVALTYNLYWTSYGPASMADHLTGLDQESVHFFNALRELLVCPHFLPKGGVVGFTCSHVYPLTAGSSKKNLPHTLKGLDMIVYQVLKRLTGAAKVSALLHYPYDDYDSDSSGVSSSGDEVVPNCSTKSYIGDVSDEPANVNGSGEDGFTYKDIVHYSNDTKSYNRAYERQKVTWLNFAPGENTRKEFAAAFIAYGNQHELDCFYSSAVVTARLARAEERPRV